MAPEAGPDDSRPQVGEVIGTVRELLPSALVRVALDGEHLVTAHMSGEPSRNFVRLLVGDRVRVALSPTDRTRGRVVGKL
jgi:translation initiation factor IF-1